jgi:hypothetical protein
MKGDFSRIRFNPSRHYTSVLEQQGRVSLDADGNEQRAIDEYIRSTENDDIIGTYGAPKHNAGFAMTLGSNGLQIGAGRYYVNGILCENETLLDYVSQPYLLNPPSQAQLFRDLRASKYSSVQVFLEVWQRLVTALDDSCLREPALGQADTTARLQTVWRVVAEGVLSTSGSSGTGMVGRKFVGSAKAVDVGTLSGGPLGKDVSTPHAAATPAVGGGVQLSPCCLGMYDSITERTNFGKLSAQTSGQTGDCTCQPTPAAGYRGLENQLYRVEIHQAGDETTATFKWSRENGSVVVAVTGVSGSDVVVDSLGPDANLGFQAGEWIEVSDDTFLFGVPANQPGDLYQITKTTPEQLTLTMNQTVAAVDTIRNARLRRWEQFGAAASATGVPLSAGTWLDLENGIQVQFAPGQYQSGDYWLIPARTASGQIEWPPCGSDGSDFQPPKFTHVYRAPLACIHTTAKRQLTIDDCRLFFLPLTELGAAQVAPALYVNAINWLNDDFLTMDQLLATGLKVTLDAALTGDIDASTFIFSLEVPTTGTFFARGGASGGAALIRTPFVVDGVVTQTGNDVLWHLPREGNYTWYIIDEMLLPGASVAAWTRARVKLLGRNIFNGTAANRVFLDGQSYGTNAFRQDGKTPRIDLQLPSGNSERASDFESWFYLAPALSISSFAIAPAAVKLVPNALGGFIVVDVNDNGNPPTPVSPTGTVTLNYPALSDTVVNLSVMSGSGAPGILSFPNTVTVKAGQQSVQFQVGVSNPGANTQSYEINALITLAGNLTSSSFAPFSVTGFGFMRVPGIFNLEKLNSLTNLATEKTLGVVKKSTRNKASSTGSGAVTKRAATTPTAAQSAAATTENQAPTGATSGPTRKKAATKRSKQG